MENARWKTQRQCVTSSKIRPQYFQRYKALGDGPIYFSFAVAIYLNWSKVNFQEKLSLYQVIFGCHTLTHSIVLRRLPQQGQPRSINCLCLCVCLSQIAKLSQAPAPAGLSLALFPNYPAIRHGTTIRGNLLKTILCVSV